MPCQNTAPDSGCPVPEGRGGGMEAGGMERGVEVSDRVHAYTGTAMPESFPASNIRRQR